MRMTSGRQLEASATAPSAVAVRADDREAIGLQARFEVQREDAFILHDEYARHGHVGSSLRSGGSEMAMEVPGPGPIASVPVQLFDEHGDQAVTERPDAGQAEICRQPDAVVRDDDGESAVLPAERDVDPPRAPRGECVLEGVRHQLGHDESARHRAVQIECRRHAVVGEGEHDVAPRVAMQFAQQIRQTPEVIAELHTTVVLALVQELVDQAHGAQAALARLERRPHLRWRMHGLQAQQARHHLQIVLHPVMHLVQQDRLLPQCRFELRLRSMPGGHIEDRRQDPRAAVRHHRVQADLDREGRAIAPDRVQFPAQPHRPAGRAPLERHAVHRVPLARRRRHQRLDRPVPSISSLV